MDWYNLQVRHFRKINPDFAAGKAVSEGDPRWRGVRETKKNCTN